MFTGFMIGLTLYVLLIMFELIGSRNSHCYQLKTARLLAVFIVLPIGFAVIGYWIERLL